MADTKLHPGQFDWDAFANNVKYAENSTTGVPVNGSNVNFNSNGAGITFTAKSAGVAFVQVKTAIVSTTDFEHKPQVFLNGTLYKTSSTAAQAGNGSSRVQERHLMCSVPFSAGSVTLSAGVVVSSATSPSAPVGGVSISAIIFAEL